MPRGKYVNHKGRSRHFTSPEELQQENEESSSEESSEEDEKPGVSRIEARGAKPKSVAPAGKMPTSSEESEEESEEDRGAKKGVAGLIEIENPNRAVKNVARKVSKINVNDDEPSSPPELSRRHREQLEKEKARKRYEKLHAEGKTAQAKADLARLALIKQQRAEAAAKREAEMNKKKSSEKPSS